MSLSKVSSLRLEFSKSYLPVSQAVGRCLPVDQISEMQDTAEMRAGEEDGVVLAIVLHARHLHVGQHELSVRIRNSVGITFPFESPSTSMSRTMNSVNEELVKSETKGRWL